MGTALVTALVVPADETQPVRHVQMTPEPATLFDTVADSNTETLFLGEVEAVIVVAAFGQQSPAHRRNVRATQIAERFLPGFAKADLIHGTAIVLGIDTSEDSDQPYGDVPSEVVDFATRLFHLTAA